MALFGLFSIGPMEWAFLGIIAVMLFGSRLPEVARNIGKGVTEFKKGLRGLESEINTSTYERKSVQYDDEIDDHEQPTAPKFEPPTSEPRDASATGDSEAAESKPAESQPA